jgi:hypothetical protein
MEISKQVNKDCYWKIKVRSLINEYDMQMQSKSNSVLSNALKSNKSLKGIIPSVLS